MKTATAPKSRKSSKSSRIAEEARRKSLRTAAAKPHGDKNPAIAAPVTPPVAKAKTAKVKKTDPKPCWCGCGGETRNKFRPGHDARFHGWSKKCARGVEGFDMDEITDKLPHQDARDEFAKCVLAERKVIAAAKK